MGRRIISMPGGDRSIFRKVGTGFPQKMRQNILEGAMSKLTRRKLLAAQAAGIAGAIAAPAVATAQTQRWRMVTSWPRRLPGPGMSAERIAERIATLSGGRLQIQVHAAGEVVPALEVLDAVGRDVAELGHTAAFYWQGKQPAAAFYTTVPFGLTPSEHVAWVEAGGGQALWDELYAPFGVKPFMGGNTGVCMGGWFRRELKGLDDLKGLKIRALGLGGEVFRRLGATPQTTSPGEILTSLQSGVLDAAEFVGPGSDIALGFYRVAPFYYGPGFNKPNGTGECIVSLKAWNALGPDLKAAVAHACATEATFALAEMERLNADALAALTSRNNVQLRSFPGDLVAAARRQAADVLSEVAGRGDLARKVHESYVAFRERTAPWSRISLRAVLEAREG
jgi:TRAP-type mannitol/chloroaromatic compound transport system substrate-binding protein